MLARIFLVVCSSFWQQVMPLQISTSPLRGRLRGVKSKRKDPKTQLFLATPSLNNVCRRHVCSFLYTGLFGKLDNLFRTNTEETVSKVKTAITLTTEDNTYFAFPFPTAELCDEINGLEVCLNIFANRGELLKFVLRKTHLGRTMLFSAIDSGDFELVTQLVKQGANVNWNRWPLQLCSHEVDVTFFTKQQS